MAAEEEDLDTGPVHIGDTRPPLVPVIGLPFSAAVPLLLAATETQMLFGGLRGVGIAMAITLPIGLFLRVWTAWDWYGVNCIRVWARTKGPIMDGRRWGGASVSHFPVRSSEIRGMSHV